MAKKIEIQNHILVPPHRLLSDEEKENLLKHYNISALQLPFINIKDPMVKKLNAKMDDVIRIDRRTPTGTAPFFRRVVD